jgi:uncharacterized repeat protein (TIGR01451 family)
MQPHQTQRQSAGSFTHGRSSCAGLRRWGRIFVPLAVAVALLGGARSADAQSPVYSTSRSDAVVVQVSQVGCVNCFFPPEGADGYSSDRYERPMAGGTGANVRFDYIDITGDQAGFDATWVYYRLNLSGGTLSSKYAAEINFIGGARAERGDLFILFDQPGVKLTSAWGTTGIEIFRDNSTGNAAVGGTSPSTSDDSKATDGYETTVAVGTNVVARVSGSSLEIAIRRTFLTSLNGNVAPVRASFRGWAGNNFNRNQMYPHDHRQRNEAGSPYRWLRTAAPAGVNATQCPAAFDPALTTAHRDWLDSGTPTNTGFSNPCWNAGNLYEIDNIGSAAELATSYSLFFTSVNLAIEKTASASTVQPSQAFSYTLTVRNPSTGSGAATGVMAIDSLPAGVTFQGATGTQGTCGHSAGVVTCSIGSLAVGATVTITIQVLAPSTAGTIVNVGRVSSNETDTNTANNRATATTIVSSGGSVDVTPDGAGPLARLPSNGTDYSFAFSVRNTGTAVDSYTLTSWLGVADPTVAVIDSITGGNVTRGSRADSASVTGIAAGTAATVNVWYRVTDVATGSRQSLYLRARSVTTTTASDSGWVQIEVARPELSLRKQAVVSGDLGPGSELNYTLRFSNAGRFSAHQLTLWDSLPPEVLWKLQAIEPQLPEGILAAISYSEDGLTWEYVPSSGGCGAPAGFDGCIRHVRWVFSGEFPPATSEEADGSLTFVVRLR